MNGRAYHLKSNKFMKGDDSEDNNEAKMKILFKYFYWENDIFLPTTARWYHRNSEHYEGRQLN